MQFISICLCQSFFITMYLNSEKLFLLWHRGKICIFFIFTLIYRETLVSICAFVCEHTNTKTQQSRGEKYGMSFTPKLLICANLCYKSINLCVCVFVNEHNNSKAKLSTIQHMEEILYIQQNYRSRRGT